MKRWKQSNDSETRFSSQGEIVSRTVWLAMLASVLALVGCQSVPEFSGSEPQTTISDVTWQVRAFEFKKLRSVSPTQIEPMLVEQLTEHYKKSPRDSDYPELRLSRVLTDGDIDGKRYFVFDIQYVDDISVVYVLGSGDAILERFLISPWVR